VPSCLSLSPVPVPNPISLSLLTLPYPCPGHLSESLLHYPVTILSLDCHWTDGWTR
jgi:hypothetical protein